MVQTEQLNRAQRVEQAVEHALSSRWDAAAEINRALLSERPDDVETANRLGKALTELEDYKGAVKAYGRAVNADPMNAIARKNLARLADLGGELGPKRGIAKKHPPSTRAPLDARAHSLVEESGKSAEFDLIAPNASALRRLAAGDAAVVQPTSGGVEITTPRGAVLGTIDRRAGLRLKRMIEGGNEYVVVIRHIAKGEATVHIRESRSDPSLADQASFIAPAKAATKKRSGTRAYTRSSVVVQHDAEDPDPDDDAHDAQDGVVAARSGTQADEMEERGFTETRSDDDEDEDDRDDDDDSEDEDEL